MLHVIRSRKLRKGSTCCLPPCNTIGQPAIQLSERGSKDGEERADYINWITVLAPYQEIHSIKFLHCNIHQAPEGRNYANFRYVYPILTPCSCGLRVVECRHTPTLIWRWQSKVFSQPFGIVDCLAYSYPATETT